MVPSQTRDRTRPPSQWAEMDAIFPKSWPFHIGGDEVYFGCWGGCPAAMAFANASGWDGNTRDIYNWVEQQMVAALKPLNRTLIGWEDIVGFPNGSFTQNGYAVSAAAPASAPPLQPHQPCLLPPCPPPRRMCGWSSGQAARIGRGTPAT